MLFNSPEYLIFFVIVFLFFWFLLRGNLKIQNAFLLAANYIFYGWWDWRFLFLIIFISALNYFAGIQIGKKDPDTENGVRKKWLLFSILINLSLLAVFKYFNFFADSAVALFNSLGFNADGLTVDIILPIGISFYTFQTISYITDVYRTKVEPTRNLIAFFAYVSFFPLLLAGPIERADNLLKQFFYKKEFNYSQCVEGLRQILWGLFKKIVVADRAAIYVNAVFNNPDQHSGISFIAATFLFAFQIYADFSGYSDIAIGSAKLLGFNLTTNFRLPYFSRDIAEFWRRWHISLSTWLRDYLFMPLNLHLRDMQKWGSIIAILVTFFVCGLWHGAKGTFIIWGILHGLFLGLNQIKKTSGAGKSAAVINLPAPLKIGLTFSLVCFSWIFFRANSIGDSFLIIKKIFSFSGPPYIPEGDDVVVPIYAVIAVAILLVSEFNTEFFKGKFSLMHNKNIAVRYSVYVFLLLMIILTGVYGGSQFIYFQF